MGTCRLCGKLRDPDDSMDNPKPCGCPYTDAMKARDVVERVRGDMTLMADLLDKVIGRKIR